MEQRYMARYQQGTYWVVDTFTYTRDGSDYRRIKRFTERGKAELHARLRNAALARIAAGRAAKGA